VLVDPILSTREARAQWAKNLSASLAHRRTDRAAGVGVPSSRTTIDAAIDGYLEGAQVRLRKRTLTTYALAFDRLRTWAKTESITRADELTPAKLASLRDALVRAPKRTAVTGAARGRHKATGAPRSSVSVNRELRTLGTLLTAWRRRELVTLTSDQIGDAMKALPIDRDLPVYHSPTDLRRLLAAALRHDAATFVATREEHAGATLPGGTARFPSIAPFAAFLLLTGCRLGEALSLRWADVDLDALDSNGAKVGEFRLRASDVKTRRARVVGLEVSPALRKIIAALKLRAGSADRVFDELTQDACTAARARLIADYGAPALTWKGLRSTCSTYLTNAPGIYGAASAFLAARQLGHSVVVAERRYAGTLRGLPKDAHTLEAAMQIADALGEVLAAIGLVGRSYRHATSSSGASQRAT